MNSAFLGVYINQTIKKSQLLTAFKTIFKNEIHSFGFSKLLKRVGEDYFRYAGSYKPLAYYEDPIQSLIRK